MVTTTIRKTVDIPANRRLYLELPQDTPTGEAEVTLTITGAAGGRQSVANPMSAQDAIEHCRGLAKRMGSRLTSSLSLAWRHKDRELEEIQYQRQLGNTATRESH
ncbi:MAG: hypothetical protein LBD20_01385 [Spirochaetaceae bacterium]|nr:hypothetical protein [Spirochaetaceae bacterium]